MAYVNQKEGVWLLYEFREIHFYAIASYSIVAKGILNYSFTQFFLNSILFAFQMSNTKHLLNFILKYKSFLYLSQCERYMCCIFHLAGSFHFGRILFLSQYPPIWFVYKCVWPINCDLLLKHESKNIYLSVISQEVTN